MHRERRFTLPALALTLTLAAAGAAAQEPAGVTLYRDADHQGPNETFAVSTSDLGTSRLGSDRASSVRVTPGCRAILYEHSDYRGRRQVVERDVVTLVGSEIGNDTVSSLEVDCRGARAPIAGTGGVTLHEDTEFSGRRQVLLGDDPDLRDDTIGNDTVSSVEVSPGCEATLYEHTGYRGASTRLTDSVASLRGTRVGNDRVSSVRVACRGPLGPPPSRLGEPGGLLLFEHTGHRGRSQLFTADDASLGDDPMGPRAVSSLRLAPGCHATLYSEPSWRGESLVVTGDIDDLGTTRIGNDRVASVRVDCRGLR